MKILLTNDDGIEAEGIRALARWARKLGEVTVIAPRYEQSGKSHAIEFTKLFEIRRADFCGIEAWSVDSTPADCVRFGFMGLKVRYDLVLSGINRGVNLGQDIVYSGTVGAIFEAYRMQSSGIAISTYPDTLEHAVARLDRVFDYFSENKLLELNPLYNVNIPKDPSGIRITKQGSPYFSDEFCKIGADLYMQSGHKLEDCCPEDAYRDTVATESGYISITPLCGSRTNLQLFEKLNGF